MPGESAGLASHLLRADADWANAASRPLVQRSGTRSGEVMCTAVSDPDGAGRCPNAPHGRNRASSRRVGCQCPLSPAARRPTIAISTQPATTTMALVASPRTDEGETADDSSMAAAAQRLADAAGAFRAAAETPRDGSDFAMCFSEVEAALGDLASGAELSAYAVTAAERPDGVSATHAPPTPVARSLSWRLHGLRREPARRARGLCGGQPRAAAPRGRVMGPHVRRAEARCSRAARPRVCARA